MTESRSFDSGDDERYPLPISESSEIRDAAARHDLPRSRVQLALDAVRTLSDDAFGLLEEIVDLARSGEHDEQLGALSEVLRSLRVDEAATSDPLAAVDEPLTAVDSLSAQAMAETEIAARRRAFLRESVSAAEAARRTGRSRQAVERLRRQGRALALRVRSQWRYPIWQLDADAPGGIVAGLERVMAPLGLSPVAAGIWLTRPHVELAGRTPIERLRAGQVDQVAALAEVEGRMS